LIHKPAWCKYLEGYKALDKTDNQFYMSDSKTDEHKLENQEDNTEVTDEGGAKIPMM